MGKKGPLWWRESDWLLRGSSAANQILLRHSGPILSDMCPFAGPLIPLFWTSGDVSKPEWAASFTFDRGVSYVRSLTPADVLAAPGRFPHMR